MHVVQLIGFSRDPVTLQYVYSLNIDAAANKLGNNLEPSLQLVHLTHLY
jgi:hypothetical protein